MTITCMYVVRVWTATARPKMDKFLSKVVIIIDSHPRSKRNCENNLAVAAETPSLVGLMRLNIL